MECPKSGTIHILCEIIFINFIASKMYDANGVFVETHSTNACITQKNVHVYLLQWCVWELLFVLGNTHFHPLRSISLCDAPSIITHKEMFMWFCIWFSFINQNGDANVPKMHAWKWKTNACIPKLNYKRWKLVAFNNAITLKLGVQHHANQYIQWTEQTFHDNKYFSALTFNCGSSACKANTHTHTSIDKV